MNLNAKQTIQLNDLSIILYKCEQHALTTSQLLTLIAIALHAQVTTKMIIHFGITQSRVQPNLNKLLKLNLITRTTKFKYFEYQLTPRGQDLIHSILT